MKIREFSLPNGWYPRNEGEASSVISGYLTCFNESGFNQSGRRSSAVLSPHAGWYFCDRLAARAFSALESRAQTIIILGGHLPAGYPPLFAMEDAVRTPFGLLPIDAELRSLLYKKLGGKEDCCPDNTVEALLPMAHYFFPDAKLLWLRLPAGAESFNAGRAIYEAACKLNRSVNVAASTDLTHYGKNYGFSPFGSGSKALRKVREVTDAAFIRAVESFNSEEVLRCAEQDNSACSAGAVLGMIGFAKAQGITGAELLEYTTSADMQGDDEPDSFVGYAAMRVIT